MRILLLIAASGSIVLGLWLIANGFIAPEPGSAPAAQAAAAAAPGQITSPVGPGIALLAGGVFFLILILRRR